MIRTSLWYKVLLYITEYLIILKRKILLIIGFTNSCINFLVMKYICVLIRNRLFSSVKSWSSSSKRKLILKWCDQKVRIEGNSAEACLRNKKMWYELQVLFVSFKISTQYINSNHNVKFRSLTSIAVFFFFL